jgi:two-component system, chemotaxis family, chemotaxis protein CheY
MRALIVDDSKVVRSYSSKILDDMGIEHVEAEDGRVALEQINNHQIDFILLDWNMPEMNGPEFLIEIKKDQRFQEIPVIFCTTENEFSKIQHAMRIGASEFIMKPYDAEIIKTKLEQLGLA